MTTRTIRRDIADWALAMPVATALGFRFVHLHDGSCETHLTWRPTLSHNPGAFQATPIGALADFTGASAAMSTQPTRGPAITVDYTLKLLAEARGDALVARAACSERVRSRSPASTSTRSPRPAKCSAPPPSSPPASSGPRERMRPSRRDGARS